MQGVVFQKRPTANALRKWLSLIEFAQNESEFSGLLEHVQAARSVLEIGSRCGESIYRIAKCLPAKSKIVAVDWPHQDDCILDTETALRERLAEVSDMGHETHLILGDSHAPEIIEQVKALGPFDFCFIDGDHSEAGVRQDWEHFGPLAKVVAFHDICGQKGCVDLWQELKRRYRTVEFTHSGWMGIGILFRGENA